MWSAVQELISHPTLTTEHYYFEVPAINNPEQLLELITTRTNELKKKTSNSVNVTLMKKQPILTMG